MYYLRVYLFTFRREFTYLVYISTARHGTVRIVNSWNLPRKLSSLCCLWFTCMRLTTPDQRILACTCVQFTRNHAVQISPTLRHSGCEQLKTQTIGFYEVLLCCVTSNKCGDVNFSFCFILLSPVRGMYLTIHLF